MRNSEVIDYITGKLTVIKDEKQRKEALLSIVGALIEKGVITFKDGASAGYLDEMELAGSEGELKEVKLDEVIEAVMGGDKKQTLHGEYEGYQLSNDNVTRSLFGIDPEGKFRHIERQTQAVVKVVGAELTGEREDRTVRVLLKNLSKVREVLDGLDAEDKFVFFAVCDLVEHGICRVSPIQLYRKLVMKSTVKPTEEQLESLHASLVKMAEIYIELDVDAILDVFPGIGAIKHEGNLIEVTGWTIKTEDGDNVRYYEFGRTLPALAQYAIAVKQMTTLQPKKIGPFNWGIRRTRYNVEIVNMIGDRVTTLASMKSQGKRIYPNMYKLSYQSFYDKADFSKDKTPDAVRKRKSRIRNAIRKQLEYLLSYGVIERYEELTDGVEVYPKGAD